MPTEKYEAVALQSRDLEDMAAHRWAAPKKQSLIDPSAAAAIAPRDKRRSTSSTKLSSVDHKSHDMFVELEELQYDPGNQLQWRETARWVKYEENVVEEADKWGKPHVASLSFHALLELRKCIEHGTVLLDLDEEDLPSIAAAIVDNMIATNQLTAQYREPILHALLLRHVHQSHPHAVKEEAPARPSSHFFGPRVDVESAFVARRDSRAPLVRPGMDLHSSDTFPRRSLSQSSSHATASAFPMRQVSAHSRASSKVGDSACACGFSNVVESEPHHDPHVDDGPSTSMEPQHDPVAASFGASVERQSSIQKDEQSEEYPTFSRRNSFSRAISGGSGGSIGVRDLSTLLQYPENSTASNRLPREERHLLKHLPSDVEGTTVLVGALDFLSAPIIAFVRLSKGRQLGHVTEVPIPVRFLFVMLGPPDYDFGGLGSTSYHEIGRSIATLMADKEVLESIYSAQQRNDILLTLDLFLDDSIVLPPGRWEDKDKLDLMWKPMTARQKRRQSLQQKESPPSEQDKDDPLARTNRFCGGLIKDVQRLRRRWLSDFKDVARVQVFFATLFMYFGALAPVITFGGLLGKKTEGNIGLSEMLLSTSIGGMIFSLLSAQPLMLIGPTGPLLVFEQLIFTFCRDQEIPFFQFRFWTGIWVFFILFIVVATDASFLVKKFTRFTEEVFAFLIGFIFIFESVKSIVDAFKLNPIKYDYCSLERCTPVDYINVSDFNVTNLDPKRANVNATCLTHPSYKSPKSPQYSPNSALVYMILVFLTFFLANALRTLRQSRYLSKEIRHLLSDFGILITITVAVLIGHFALDGVELDFVKKSGFTTTVERALVVDPLGKGIKVGYIFAASVPALLVAFLAFVETQVTCLLVTNPDHRLVKGQGFHWNLFIIAVLIAVSSMLDMPWLTGTPVPSLSHTTSLLLYEKARAPGERPKITGAIEQRVSNFAIHALLLITLTPPISKLLQQVPISVLFGVFLFLGVVSLMSLQFSHRLVLLLVPTKHHPDNMPYVSSVRVTQMHKYTLIQVACLAALIIVKLTPAAIVFPVIIFLMVPLRTYFVTRHFSERELKALDSHETSHPDHDVDGVDKDEVCCIAV